MLSAKYANFILNALLLLSLIFFADQVIGRTLRYFYFKQQSGLYYRTTYAIDSTKAEILVFGSSRANHHYVPEIFENNLHMSFYNTGRDGNFLLYNATIFKAIVKRYNPKIVIFDINPNELYYDKTNYDRLSSLLPYYKNHPEIQSIVNLKSPFEKYKLVSEIYPFNSSLLTIIIGNTELNKTRKTDINGYVPLLGYLKDTVIHSINYQNDSLDTNKANATQYIISFCKENVIKLLLIQSPMFAKINKTISSIFIENLAYENIITYLDFTSSPEFINNPGYFQDPDHLNNSGARYFTKLLVKKIIDLQASTKPELSEKESSKNSSTLNN